MVGVRAGTSPLRWHRRPCSRPLDPRSGSTASNRASRLASAACITDLPEQTNRCYAPLHRDGEARRRFELSSDVGPPVGRGPHGQRSPATLRSTRFASAITGCRAPRASLTLADGPRTWGRRLAFRGRALLAGAHEDGERFEWPRDDDHARGRTADASAAARPTDSSSGS